MATQRRLVERVSEMSTVGVAHSSGLFRVCRYGTVTSTMDVARSLAESSPTVPTLVLATGQTAGRGTAHRSWYSAASSNLFMTLRILEEFIPTAFASLLPLIVGLCIRLAVERHVCGARLSPQMLQAGSAVSELAVNETRLSVDALLARVRLKWPNDVLCGTAKVAGVLIEPCVGGHLVGVGVNVLETPPEHSTSVDGGRAAGSLAQYFGSHWTLDADTLGCEVSVALLQWLCMALEAAMAGLSEHVQREALIRNFERHMVKDVVMHRRTSAGRGAAVHAVGLDTHGCLVVEEVATGELSTLAADYLH